VPLPPPLVALSPGDLDAAAFPAFLERLERARAAGLAAVLLREPRLSDRDTLALGRAVRASSAALWLGLHDRAHLAAEVGASAVHLSFRSLRPRELRPWLGAEIALGLSTHAGDDPAAWAGADYLFHGPLHDTPSKRGLVAPIGLEGLGDARAATRLPLIALGGVTPADAPRLRALGLHGVAVRAPILSASDPARATRAYLEAWGA